jgi:hypothetical protein
VNVIVMTKEEFERVVDKIFYDTFAEHVIDSANVLKSNPGRLITDGLEGCDVVHLARYKIAMDFDKLPTGTKLRAIVEDWDHRRVMLELY